MADQQRNLFRLPKPVDFDLTYPQRAVLDWAAYNDAKHAAFPDRLSKQSLRALMAKGLVKKIETAPPLYVVTPLGWAVRGRRVRSERLGLAPLMSSMSLSKDCDE